MRKALTYCVCILLTMRIFAADIDREINDSIDDTWDVLIHPYPINDSSNFTLSIHSIFQVIEKSLLNAPHHIISEEERRSIARSLRDKRVVELAKEIDTTVTSRDNLLFSSEDNTYKRRSEQRKFDKTIRNLQKAINAIEEIPLSDINVYTKREIILKEPDIEALSGIEYAYQLNNLAKENEFEQIIYAEVEPISDISVYLILSEYNTILDKHRVLTEGIATLGDAEETMRRVIPVVSRAIIGADTANLVVAVKNQQDEVVTYASVYVDDEFNGYGMIEDLFVYSGKKNIDIFDGDTLLHTKEITLLPGETRELYFYVDIVSEQLVEIISNPPIAKVYVNAIQVGVTPMQIPRSANTRSIYLTKDGYYPAWVLINPRSPTAMDVNLIRITENSREVLRKKRELFYKSVAYMAFSVPFPMAFSALYQGRASYLDAPNLSADARSENKVYHDAFQGAFWGTLGVTLSLTGYMFYRLTDYIRYANIYDKGRIIE